MKRKNVSGFAVLEMLLFVVLVAVIAGAAYYVGTNQSKTTNKTASSQSSKAPLSTASWQIYNGYVAAEAQNPAVSADQVAYTFKYPEGWKFYPIGTTITGRDGPNSFQEIVPSDQSGSNDGLIFNSTKTDKPTAEEYYKSVVGDQSKLVGPVWQGVGSFTTKKGYSGYTAKLASDRGTSYETYISDNNGKVVTFTYADINSKYFVTFNQIYDTVTFN